ncbi:urease accessory protein UreE [Chitinophaga horti]|uniref:Urease accessory protein UreE n=1 Tax=Chitinophaga horti TaxID=2920382 RepID=A0ABY6IXC3_9BACT|nr:urease accessory protein UreE [Chitinophaga horti]UYQ91945.1 urease accessory protein UreE [Chitinophaga horti]
MLIREKVGHVAGIHINHLQKDALHIEWFDAAKRIQRLRTQSGCEVAIKFLQEGQRLEDGDILYMDDTTAIVVHIVPCDAIVIQPKDMLEMGTVCYEIGNKHLPIFLQEDEVLIPYEEPLFRWLQAAGFAPAKAVRQLRNMLKSNVTPHSHGTSANTLFSRIMNLASK